MVDSEVWLSIGISLLLLYCIYLHILLKTLRKELILITDEIEDLDSKANHFKAWSFRMHNWLNNFGGKKFE